MSAGSRAPDFMIIGSQKAASTALAEWLRAHPDVWLPEYEDHFFHDPIYRQQTRVQFITRYSGASTIRVGMKCPDYLGSPEVPARVRQTLGLPQFLACLRNPAERALSAYFWYMRWGVIPARDPNEGLARLLAGEYDALPMARQILDYGRYGHHLAHWMDYFPRDNFLILLQDDLRSHPRTALDRVLSFLRLSPHREQLPTDNSRANAGIYPLQRIRFLRIRNRFVQQWDPTGQHLFLMPPEKLPLRVLSMGIAGVDRFLLSRVFGNEPPEVNADVWRRLHEYYCDDVAKLEQLIGQDLSSWR